MASRKPIDSKREELRKYLEIAGAMDTITRAFVLLYNEPEKPADALEYIRKHLEDDNGEDDTELNVLKTELDESHFKIQTLEIEVELLKEKLAQYEPAGTTTMEKGVGGEPGTVVQSEASLPNGEATKSAGASSSKPAGASSSKRAGASSSKRAGASSSKPAGASSSKPAGASSSKPAGASSSKPAGASSSKPAQ